MSVAGVALLDVDLTLLATGGAGLKAIDRTIAELSGSTDAAAGIRFDGRTDPGIFAEILARLAERAVTPPLDRQAVQDRYLVLLEEELQRASSFQLCPGVPEVLDRLAGRGIALGLCTGNLQRGAELKVARAGLTHHFAFGGYGEDGTERPDVARAAVRRAADHLGEPLDLARTWIIGDTPLDVEAAHAAGAQALGVGTGRYSAAELLAAEADHAVADLTDAEWLDVCFP